MERTLLKILTCCSILLFFNCQNDDFIKETDAHAHDNGIIINRISGQELKAKVPSVFKKAQSLNQPKNTDALARGVMIDDEYEVETDEVIEISKDGITHYTFSISRTVPTDLVENLVISVDADGILTGKIVTYDLTEEEKQAVALKNYVALTDKMNVKEVENINNVASLFMRTGLDCVEFIPGGPTCPEEGHHNMSDMLSGNCGAVEGGRFIPSVETMVQIIVDDGCLGDSGGGIVGNPTDPGTNPTNPGTGGGGGTTNPNPVITTPLLELDKTPCQQLKKLKNNAVFNEKMTTLKNNIGGTKEKGFMMIDNPSNEFSAIIEGDDEGNIEFPYSTMLSDDDLQKFYGTAHNHLENDTTHIGIFTPEDFDSVLLNGIIETHPSNIYKKTKPEKAISVLITKMGIFAMKINDLSKLNNFVTEYKSIVASGPEKVKLYLDEKFSNPHEYNILPSSTHDEQVTGFLRFLKDKDIGIDLYEGNKNNFDGWKKLSLHDNGNGTFSHTAEPCN